jgi:hypothetical protein
MPSIAVYVSSHGFGHAVRVAEVVSKLIGLGEGLRVHVRTGAPRWLFPRADSRVLVHHAKNDVGMAQPHGLAIDFEGTLAGLEEFERGFERRVLEEAAWLAETGAMLVLGDVPPLAFAAAEQAGVTSIALGNFDWEWVYRSYSGRDRRFGQHAERAAACYAKALRALRLPFHSEMDAFRSVVDVPLIARRLDCSRAEARKRLGLPAERPLVLLSFGGLGFTEIRVGRFAEMADILFLATEAFRDPPVNLRCLDRPDVDYTLLLRACDAVITKPGYGIVAACIANAVRVLYTTRGEFPETPILIRALEEHATGQFVALDDLENGEIRGPLESLLGRPVSETRMPVDGAERVSEILFREAQQ